MASAWDAARLASRRPLRKAYKPVAPVGVKLERPAFGQHEYELHHPGGSDIATCLDCGYHVCSCAKHKPEPVQSGSLCALYQQKAELEAKLMNSAREAIADQLRQNLSRSAAFQALAAQHASKRAESMRGQSLDSFVTDESKFMLELQGKSGREIALPTEPDKRRDAINLLTTGRINPCPNTRCRLDANHFGPCVVVDKNVPPGGWYFRGLGSFQSKDNT